ncbi:MAG: transketolase [Acidimicrobiales bacterium]
MSDKDLEQLGINVIRGLAMDAPQRANSGHPGTAMALAPLAHVLWTRIMRFDPSEPHWADRDRFILSCGHASILLYSMLYLTGYGLTLDDIKEFRQWESLTPGHPEVHHTAGVEVTTGPLGQGFANGVGMAVAERYLRDRFGAQACDHHTFVICSDGDLEEGVSHEAASLAGHLGLGRMTYIYDDNHITIDGPTELSYTDDKVGRFRAYNWHVEDVGEAANDCDLLEAAIRRAMAVEDKPSLIVLRSHIGWPAPNATDTAGAHGSPLGAEEIRATKEILGLPPEEDFWVPEEVVAMYREAIPRGQAMRRAWEDRQGPANPELAAALSGRGLAGWEAKLPTFEAGKSLATRQAVKSCINSTLEVIPGLISGGADLTGNTGTALSGEAQQSAEHPGGRQVYYGIREHAMGGIMNGMSFHGGVLPVGGTFFIFSDYMRASVRLAAVTGAHVIYSWTHDSIGLGEDGTTHQPIEHLASLRAMPGLRVVRPADANECAQAWLGAVDGDGPTALILTRQGVPVLAETAQRAAAGVPRGAYVLAEGASAPAIVLVGTGSEVHLCVEAAAALASNGVAVRVVSMPCWEDFSDQDDAYRASVLPPGVPVLAVEAGCSFGWERWADATVTIDRFGASAPGPVLMEKLGFSTDNVVRHATELLARRSTGGSSTGGTGRPAADSAPLAETPNPHR